MKKIPQPIKSIIKMLEDEFYCSDEPSSGEEEERKTKKTGKFQPDTLEIMKMFSEFEKDIAELKEENNYLKEELRNRDTLLQDIDQADRSKTKGNKTILTEKLQQDEPSSSNEYEKELSRLKNDTQSLYDEVTEEFILNSPLKTLQDHITKMVAAYNTYNHKYKEIETQSTKEIQEHQKLDTEFDKIRAKIRDQVDKLIQKNIDTSKLEVNKVFDDITENFLTNSTLEKLKEYLQKIRHAYNKYIDIFNEFYIPPKAEEQIQLQYETRFGELKDKIKQQLLKLKESTSADGGKNEDSSEDRKERAENINKEGKEIKKNKVSNIEPLHSNYEVNKDQEISPIIPFKLEKIELPIFNGELTEWQPFRDIYEALIHSNNRIGSTLKFHQLRSHLRGTALDTIKGYQLTEANYESAWDDVKNRYDRNDFIIHEYIKKFFEIPIISGRASVFKLQAIIDGTKQMLRALPAMGTKVDQWDPFVSFIILSKLDDETRKEWGQKIGKQGKTPLKTLLEFLEIKAIELQPSQSERLYNMMTNKKDLTRKVFQISNKTNKNSKTEVDGCNQCKTSTVLQLTGKGNNRSNQIEYQPTKCPLCGGRHPLYKCPLLLKEKAKERTEIIKRLRLCYKCLGEHEIGDCPKHNCPHCGGPHNLVICYKLERERERKASERKAAERKNEEDWEEAGPSKNMWKGN